MRIKLLLLVGIPALIFTSCGDGPIVDDVPEDTVEQTTEDIEENEDYYQIPSPDEMFGFIKESGLEYNAELLNPTQNLNSYMSPTQKTLNFGIYSADLAYSAAFENFNTSISYFSTIQKLSEGIGIAGAFSNELISKVQNNLDNPEGLLDGANESYFSIVDYLEKNEQGGKLGLIASAGWLETVYIAINTTDYEKDKIAVERLADQKLILENLLDYLNKYSNDDDVKSLITRFQELEVVFSDLPESQADREISLKKREDGKMVLSGGSSSVLGEDQFNAIKDKVNEIRNNIVSVES